MDRVLKLQQASYELAQPDNMSLELLPPSSNSPSQGILLVSHAGNRGVIMVAGMESLPVPPPATMCGSCAVKTRSGRVRLGLTIAAGALCH